MKLTYKERQHALPEDVRLHDMLTVDKLQQLNESGKPFIVDFYADWCVACQEMMPVVDSIIKDYPDVVVYKVNTDDNPELAEASRIKAIPMIHMYKDGRLREFVYGKQERDKIDVKLNRLYRR